MTRRLLLCLCLLGALAPAAQARPMNPAPMQAPAQAPTWGQLTPRQQAELAPLERRWDQLPPHRRMQILRRHAHWQRLPPEQRDALRAGHKNFRELSPRQRDRMRDSMRALRELPPDEQRRLRALWRGMTPEQRREWLRRGGPGLAAPP